MTASDLVIKKIMHCAQVAFLARIKQWCPLVAVSGVDVKRSKVMVVPRCMANDGQGIHWIWMLQKHLDKFGAMSRGKVDWKLLVGIPLTTQFGKFLENIKVTIQGILKLQLHQKGG